MEDAQAKTYDTTHKLAERHLYTDVVSESCCNVVNLRWCGCIKQISVFDEIVLYNFIARIKIHAMMSHHVVVTLSLALQRAIATLALFHVSLCRQATKMEDGNFCPLTTSG